MNIRYSIKGKGLTIIIDKIPQECIDGAKSYEEVKARYFHIKEIDWRQVRESSIDPRDEEEA